MYQFSRLVSLALVFLGLLADYSLADRLALRRPPFLRRNKSILRNFRLQDTDVDFFPFNYQVETTTTSPNCVESSVPRLLQQPFQEALLVTSEQNGHEIETEKLLTAVGKLKEAMNAVGQDRNAAEIERNLQKIKSLYRMAPRGRRETLRSLLEYEKELGVHGPNGRLKDPSGAMGLLWIRRSLAFQERMYSLILEKPMSKTNEAALQAYKEKLEPYHGWALQQVYSLALKRTTPSRQEMFQKLCAVPENKFGTMEEKETVQDLQKLCETWKPLLSTWQEIFESLGLEDSRKV